MIFFKFTIWKPPLEQDNHLRKQDNPPFFFTTQNKKLNRIDLKITFSKMQNQKSISK